MDNTGVVLSSGAAQPLSVISAGNLYILPHNGSGTAGQCLVTDGTGSVSWSYPTDLSIPIPLFSAYTLVTSATVVAGTQYIFSNSSPNPVDAFNVTANIASLFNYASIQNRVLQLQVTCNAGPLTLGVGQTFRVILAQYTTQPLGYSNNLQYLLTNIATVTFSDTDVNTLVPISKTSFTFTASTANSFCFYFILDTGLAGWYAGAAIDVSAQLLLVQ